MPGKSALVFGASGVTGWSVVNEILNDYPKKGIWDKVYALTNRPLSVKDSFWPNDPRLNIVSGIDLLKGSQEELEAELKSKVQGIENVTHVYFLAYKASTDLQQELKDMVAMWKRSVIASDHLAPNLEFVVLQTGAKWYGCHLLATTPQYGGTPGIEPPYREDMPRLKQPYEDMLFYHPQIDWVSDYAKDKKWNWCDTRPDIVSCKDCCVFRPSTSDSYYRSSGLYQTRTSTRSAL
jgi:nucleoside-diphosphate-sugar epimerase